VSETPEWMRPPADQPPAVDLQTDRPHPARVYDYFLGGKDNFAADREAAAQGLKSNPNGALGPMANRDFLRRAVTWLSAEAGIRQFLDIGTGIPTSPNVHEAAQAIAPETRVVYVDNDPIVLAHARALLTSNPAGSTVYLDADLRDPDAILEQARAVQDFEQPIALLLIAILHFVDDSEDPYGLAERLLASLPSGSYLVLTHLTADIAPEMMGGVAATMTARGMPMYLRDRAAVAKFAAGLEPVDEVGVVHRWRPDAADIVPQSATDADVSIYGVIARKP
jgi:hypothetical protein